MSKDQGKGAGSLPAAELDKELHPEPAEKLEQVEIPPPPPDENAEQMQG